MRSIKNSRYSHVAKTKGEKEAYRNFLDSKFSLDKTADDPVDVGKTNESSVEEDYVSEKSKPQRMSFRLKVKDFFYDHWTITIGGGVLLLVIGGYISVREVQSVQEYKIQSLQTDMKKFEEKNLSGDDKLNTLSESLKVFKAETGKDIEYIKKKIRL